MYAAWRWLTKPKHVAPDTLLIKFCPDLFLYCFINSNWSYSWTGHLTLAAQPGRRQAVSTVERRQTRRHCREFNCVVTVHSKCTNPFISGGGVGSSSRAFIQLSRSSSKERQELETSRHFNGAVTHKHVLAQEHRYAVDMQCSAPDTTVVGALFYMNREVNIIDTQTYMKRRSSQSWFGKSAIYIREPVWRSGVRIPARSVKRPCPDGLWGPPRLYWIGTGFLSQR